jgi:hypothetical protein
MNKPSTMLDLLKDGHIGLNEVNAIARAMFTNATTMAGPEGYLVTSVNFDDLPEHVQGFIRKAILQFTVENILDAGESCEPAWAPEDVSDEDDASEG